VVSGGGMGGINHNSRKMRADGGILDDADLNGEWVE